MKDNLKYSALWQNKRNDWPIESDQGADWLEMKNLLDEQLPSPPASGGSTGGATGAGNGLIKLLAVLGITVPLAVLLYFLMFNGPFKTKKQTVNMHDSSALSAPVADSAVAARLAIKDAIIAYDDSINNAQQQIINANTALNSLLTSGHKNLNTIDSINHLKQQLNAANRVLIQLVSIRNKIALQDKHRDGNAIKPYTAIAATRAANQVELGSDDKATSDDVSIIDRNASNTDPNKHSLNHKVYNAGNGAGLSNGNSPAGGTSNQFNGGNTHMVQQSNSNFNSYTANNQTGNNANGSNILGQQYNNSADLVAANGYHPDTDVFGSIATAGNYPFKNSLRPGDMRYRGRVFAGGGSSKITVNKPEKPKKEKKIKAPKNPGDTLSYFDWGLLTGVNTNGSFTGKSQNANIYGSLPVDLYTGLFGTYHFNSRFSVQAQTWLLNPLKFSGGYSHANGSKVEKGAIIQVTDSRKVYFVTVPVNFMYRFAGSFSIKGGPVISLPVKQTSGVTSLTPTVISRDTVYYRTVTGQLNATKYDTKPNIGLSGGIQVQTGRLMFDATFQKSLRGYNIVSEYGTYSNSPGVLQFTVGLKLNKGQ